ncbi:MAG: hypothetical protein ACI8XM_000809 [Haloarculaceae archaeon]|jgi:hypothetical protein
MAEVAAGRLVDEPRTDEGEGVPVAESTESQERLQTYLVRAGSVRRDPDTAWAFGRRHLDARYCLATVGGSDETATLCLLPAEGTLLVDRGGPLLENEFVAAVLGGYFEHYDGNFELHAQPLDREEVNATCARLADVGLTTADGEGRGPFDDALGRIATGLANRQEQFDA